MAAWKDMFANNPQNRISGCWTVWSCRMSQITKVSERCHCSDHHQIYQPKDPRILQNEQMAFKENQLQQLETIFARRPLWSESEIFSECENLKERGLLSKVFTHNGFVKVCKARERPRKLSHLADVRSLLNDEVF